ncbi:EamA-like transporter family protein [Dysgonomonas alginatilytica]|uniref:EamA-like transporter family protein n=1 Tax=Dysgonomonas alginatilytica TaxID=1605892 RepID=A0A2V3PNZ9_9BACT|nr:DMT family transporter [Dysgonomonas alginatilytica]PXV63002.1 EamA-like transporter family protein [Dysgonomonas alginatilytica]
MKQAFIKLHLSILIAGFTGIFGKLISLNEGVLVWYRVLITSVVFYFILLVTKNLPAIPKREIIKIGGVGLLLALHWIFFYGSIKASNVSIGVVCFSAVGFFTAVLEPLLNRHKVSYKELFFSLIAVCGILLIFQFDVQYRMGIVFGIISSAFCALFTILNKRVGANHNSSSMLLYEMLGGFVFMSCILPFYLYFIPVESLTPSIPDWIYLFLLSTVCTIGLCLLQIQALKYISAFTVNLSYNLEPIYSIILAIVIFGEAKELAPVFFIGLGIIILSILLQMISVSRSRTTKEIK